MARLARVIVPGIPHHLTQRGNRRQITFFCVDDYLEYIAQVAEWCARDHVEVWAWCLMPNHSHMILVPESEEALRHAIGEAHRRYTKHVNRREGWRGHLWQGRFFSFPMDEQHTLRAAQYIELNPVRAKLVARAEDWPWSSARAHLSGRDDALVKVAPLLSRVGDWARFLREPTEDELKVFRLHSSTGRPLGDDAFVDALEKALGRVLRPQKPGRKAANDDVEPLIKLAR